MPLELPVLPELPDEPLDVEELVDDELELLDDEDVDDDDPVEVVRSLTAFYAPFLRREAA